MTFGHFWGVPQKVLPSLLCSCFVQNHHACGQKWPTAALLSRMLLGLAPPPSGKKLQKPYCFFNIFGANQPNPATNQPTTHKPTTHKPTPSIQHPLEWSVLAWLGLALVWFGAGPGPGLALVWPWSGLCLVLVWLLVWSSVDTANKFQCVRL